MHKADLTKSRGEIIVPENHQNPTGRTISLPFVRTPAQRSGAGLPVYYLNGGPGVSNFSAPSPQIGARHDIVRLEYRGVGSCSAVLQAPRVPGVLAAVRHELNLAEAERLVPAMTRAMGEAERRFDLAGFTVAGIVEDLETLRQFLGHERIHLLGHSFGTRIALAYMAKYPQHVDRAVLAAPNPPGRFIWSPAATDRLLRRYAELYRRQYPERGDLYDLLHSVMAKLPRRWLTFPIHRAKVQMMSYMLLFNPFGARYVFDCFHAAGRGNASGLAFVSQSYDHLLPTLFSWGAFLAMGVSADYDPRRLEEVDREGRDAIFGSPSSLLFGAARDTLSAAVARNHRPYRSEVETLLLTGELDASTPPANIAADLLPGMPRAKHLDVAGMGHVGPMYNHPSVTANLLLNFYESGQVGSFPGTVPDLRTGVGFPLLASSGLGFAALMGSSLYHKLRA